MGVARALLDGLEGEVVPAHGLSWLAVGGATVQPLRSRTKWEFRDPAMRGWEGLRGLGVALVQVDGSSEISQVGQVQSRRVCGGGGRVVAG